uniref:TEA domain family member 1b n=1 Tax=Cyprinus carpio TaxID=7962 RepID=A0A8C1NB61_CYPCA
IDPSSWSGSESSAEDIERMSDSADKPIDNDAEGVWSPDIEQSFQEALAIYPPCGRRKIILSDEGKMYGRNELIARYIKLRTGKTRTRKQVSSHIQVLARRKSREFHSKLKVCAFLLLGLWLPCVSLPVSCECLVALIPSSAGFWSLLKQHNIKPFAQQAYPIQPAVTTTISSYEPPTVPAPTMPAWQGRSIGTSKLRLVEFSAFLEHQRDPDSADLNCNIQDETGAFYGVSSQYESPENMTITCSTKVCSFGKQVVEKVETEYARFENGRFVYRISRSPMCEYMINFIHKLKHLPEKYMMNSVLENFTILLVVTNRDTQETLLCMACVFEVSNSEHGAQHHIYRLVKE